MMKPQDLRFRVYTYSKWGARGSEGISSLRPHGFKAQGMSQEGSVRLPES